MISIKKNNDLDFSTKSIDDLKYEIYDNQENPNNYWIGLENLKNYCY